MKLSIAERLDLMKAGYTAAEIAEYEGTQQEPQKQEPQKTEPQKPEPQKQEPQKTEPAGNTMDSKLDQILQALQLIGAQQLRDNNGQGTQQLPSDPANDAMLSLLR